MLNTCVGHGTVTLGGSVPVLNAPGHVISTIWGSDAILRGAGMNARPPTRRVAEHRFSTKKNWPEIPAFEVRSHCFDAVHFGVGSGEGADRTRVHFCHPVVITVVLAETPQRGVVTSDLEASAYACPWLTDVAPRASNIPFGQRVIDYYARVPVRLSFPLGL